MQKVIRTFPGMMSGTVALSDLLSNGYNVIMCNDIRTTDGTYCLEYIVEKFEEIEEPVLYSCDRKLCGDKCSPDEECTHTTDIEHAKNFEYRDGFYVEKEKEESE